MSQHGWKKISEYEEGDLVTQVTEVGLEASLVKPLRYIKEPCNEFYTIKTKYGIDQWLSEDHSVAYTIKNKTKLNKISISEIIKCNEENSTGFRGYVPQVYNFNGKSLGLTPDEIRLGVAIKADGHFTNTSTGHCVVRLKKKRKICRLQLLLESTGTEFKVATSEDYTVFTFYAKEYSKTLHDWMFCSKSDALVILDEYKYWNGAVNKQGNRLNVFYTSSKLDADAMQYFANICGLRATISTFDRVGDSHTVNGKKYIRKSVEYRVLFNKNEYTSLLPYDKDTKRKTEFVKQPSVDGFKYCFTVPTGYLLLRRGDKVFVTGNCGKSTLTILLAISAQKTYPDERVLIVDAEQALNLEYAETLGLDTSEEALTIIQPQSANEGLGIYVEAIDSGLFSLVILDSIPALVPERDLDADVGDRQVATLASLLSAEVRKVVNYAKRTNTAALMINQVRAGIGFMVAEKVIPGGNAMKFYPSVNIELKRKDLHKKGEEYIGQAVQMNFVKNRFANPYKKCVYDLYYGEGIRKSDEAVEVAKDLGIIVGKGWYTFPIAEGQTERLQGLENVINWYKEHPEAFAYLEQLVINSFAAKRKTAVETIEPQEVDTDEE